MTVFRRKQCPENFQNGLDFVFVNPARGVLLVKPSRGLGERGLHLHNTRGLTFRLDEALQQFLVGLAPALHALDPRAACAHETQDHGRGDDCQHDFRWESVPFLVQCLDKALRVPIYGPRWLCGW